jgi:hypothetical protein
VAVAINVPNRQPQADPLEKLANALNIARQGFGIYTDLKGLEQAKQKFELEKKAMDRQSSGVVQPLDLIKAGVGDVSETPGKGMLPIEMQTPEGPVLRYVKPKSGESPLESLIKSQQSQKNQLDIAKSQKDLANPYNQLNEADKKIVLDSASKLSDTAAIKDSMDGVLEILDDPNIPYEQKMAQAKSSLKLINSATLNSPDAVGKDEADRAAAFISPSLKNALPGRQGAVLTPDLGSFTEQLRNMSNSLGSKAGKLKARVESGTGSPLRTAIGGETRKKATGGDLSLEQLMAEKERRKKTAGR